MAEYIFYYAVQNTILQQNDFNAFCIHALWEVQPTFFIDKFEHNSLQRTIAQQVLSTSWKYVFCAFAITFDHQDSSNNDVTSRLQPTLSRSMLKISHVLSRLFLTCELTQNTISTFREENI